MKMFKNNARLTSQGRQPQTPPPAASLRLIGLTLILLLAGLSSGHISLG